MKTFVRNIILAVVIPIAVIIGFFLLPLLFIFMIIILLISGGTIYKISNAKTRYRNVDANDHDNDSGNNETDVVDINYEVIDDEKKRIDKE